jgi:hypothetical protein
MKHTSMYTWILASFLFIVVVTCLFSNQSNKTVENLTFIDNDKLQNKFAIQLYKLDSILLKMNDIEANL